MDTTKMQADVQRSVDYYRGLIEDLKRKIESAEQALEKSEGALECQHPRDRIEVLTKGVDNLTRGRPGIKQTTCTVCEYSWWNM